ncbi:MAG: flagellin [Tepidibacter sp.]|uniref:flagellin N-terminal helical domain-containing protein n=1 Tax=Tepidibacter sp. TaxID=2529387 RepID=UPI0025D152EC|nr:flagellin [Tepidibacter sp.]MCT4509059.1 flagellin [Tepidibacter sp.]
MIINHNMSAINAHRMMGSNQIASSKSMEKLSSGLRINRAGDDAAGLSISEKMRSQIRGLDQASRNAQDGISMIQTAEGALQETESILQRMRELSVQGSNDTLEAQDREAIGQELKDLTSEMNRISKTTEFNGKKLLNGSLSTTQSGGTAVVGKDLTTGANATISKIDVSGALASDTYTLSDATGGKITLTRSSDSVAQTVTGEATIGADGTTTLTFDDLGITIEMTGAAGKTNANVAADLDTLTITTGANASAQFAIGANGTADEKMSVNFDKFDDTTLGSGGSKLSALVTAKAASNVITDSTEADALTSTLDEAIKQVSSQRSKLGAAQNRLEHTINNLNTSSENLTSAESRIRDVDMAKEMLAFSKNNILQQASQAMLAQAKQAPQGVLQLLR